MKGYGMRIIPALVLISAVSLAAATPSFASSTQATTLSVVSSSASMNAAKATKDYVVAQTQTKKKHKKKKKA